MSSQSSDLRTRTSTKSIMKYQQIWAFVSNMTYLMKRKGTTYHWVLELFGKMGLPTVDGIEAVIGKENEERMRRLENQKTDRAKQKRVAFT